MHSTLKRTALVGALAIGLVAVSAPAAHAAIVAPVPDDYQPVPNQTVSVSIGCDPLTDWALQFQYDDGGPIAIDRTGTTDAVGADSTLVTVPATLASGTPLTLMLWCGTTTPYDPDPAVEVASVGMMVAGAPFISIAPSTAAPGDTITANLHFCDPFESILFRLFNPTAGAGTHVDQMLTADASGGVLGATVVMPATGYAAGDPFGAAMFCGGVETADPTDAAIAFGSVLAAPPTPPAPPAPAAGLADTGVEPGALTWAAAIALLGGAALLLARRTAR